MLILTLIRHLHRRHFQELDSGHFFGKTNEPKKYAKYIPGTELRDALFFFFFVCVRERFASFFLMLLVFDRSKMPKIMQLIKTKG